MAKKENGRRPFRFLFKLIVVGGVFALLGKLVAAKKSEFLDLTESEARAKVEEKLGRRIGGDRAVEVADQVIPKLKDKGIIKPDPVEVVADKAKAAVEEVKEKVDEAIDAIDEAESDSD